MDILAKYELIIFKDGRIEIKPVLNLEEEIILSECSSRIHQIISTIITMKKLISINTNASDIEIYTNAIKQVAESFNVSPTTITDKLTRQLNLNADQSRNIIFDYLRNNSINLKNLLLQNIGKNTKTSDTLAINTIL